MTSIWKRSISMLLALVMVFGMLPMNAFATETEDVEIVSETEVPTEAAETQAPETEAVETEAPTETPEEAPAEDDVEAEEAPVEEPAEAPTEAPEVIEAQLEETEAAETEAAVEETEPQETEEQVSEPAETESEETQPEETEPEAVVTVIEEITSVADPGLPSSEELFAMYAEQTLYGTEFGFFGSAAGERLSGDAKLAYDALVPYIKEIANGERAATTITLGVNIVDAPDGNGGTVTSLVDQEVAFAGSNFTAETLTSVLGALLADLPYEMYWFDKTSGVGISGMYYGGLQITFYLAVAGNYQGSSYSVDTALTGAASDAAANAKTIVAKYADKTDYEKLVAYKDEICGLVSYNYDAANGGVYALDNDPWQLIYVFDNDSANKVVCEGYAKAFQYLCDLTEFADETIVCYNVSGNMAHGDHSENHMWNIVTIGEENYLVDVTNVDEGTIGEDGSLFLAGAEGSIAEGYVFTNTQGDEVTYVYKEFDAEGNVIDTTEVWGKEADSILTLAAADYEPPVVEEVKPTEPEDAKDDVTSNATASSTQKTLMQAIEDAKANDYGWKTVELTKDTTITADMEIPEMVSVGIHPGVTLTVKEGATLTVNGEIANWMGTFTVDGTLVNNNWVGATDTGAVITINGTVINNGNFACNRGTVAVKGSYEGYGYVTYQSAAKLDNATITKIGKENIERMYMVYTEDEFYDAVDLAEEELGEGYRFCRLWVDGTYDWSGDSPVLNQGNIVLTKDVTIPAGLFLGVGYSWTEDIDQEYHYGLTIGEGVTFVNNTEIRVNEKMYLTVEEGATLINNGAVYVYGKYTCDGEATGNKVIAAGGAISEADFLAEMNAAFEGYKYYQTMSEFTVESDELILSTITESGMYFGLEIQMGGSITVPAGKKLVLDGSLGIYGGKLIVESGGTLEITERSQINFGSGTLSVADGATITGPNGCIRDQGNGMISGVPSSMITIRRNIQNAAQLTAALEEAANIQGSMQIQIFNPQFTIPSMTIPENVDISFWVDEDRAGITLVEAGNTLTNYGTMTFGNGGEVYVEGDIENYGTIQEAWVSMYIQGDAVVTNHESGWFRSPDRNFVLRDNAKLFNNGTVENNNEVTVEGNAVLTNNGTFNNNNEVYTVGTGTVVNNGSWNGNEVLSVGNPMSEADFMAVLAEYEENWDWYHLRDAVTVESDTLTIEDGPGVEIRKGGSITVPSGKTLVIDRSFELWGGKLIVEAGGTLKLTGNNSFSIYNNGQLIVEDGGSIVGPNGCITNGDGVVSGVPSAMLGIFHSADNVDRLYAALADAENYGRVSVDAYISEYDLPSMTIPENVELSLVYYGGLEEQTVAAAGVTITNYGTLNLGLDNAFIRSGATVENYGTMRVNYSNLTVEEGAVLNNHAGATLETYTTIKALGTVTNEGTWNGPMAAVPGGEMSQADFEAAMASAGGNYTLYGKVTVEDTLTLALLSDWYKLTIAEGASITVPSGTELVIGCETEVNGGSILVENGGTLSFVDSETGIQRLEVMNGGILTVEDGATFVDPPYNGMLWLYQTNGAQINGIALEQIAIYVYATTAAEMEAAFEMIQSANNNSAVVVNSEIVLDRNVTIPDYMTLQMGYDEENYVDNAVIRIPDGYTLTNNGYIEMHNKSAIYIEEGGKLVNNEYLYAYSDSYIYADGTLENNGFITDGRVLTEGMMSYADLQREMQEAFDNDQVYVLTKEVTVPSYNSLWVEYSGNKLVIAEGGKLTVSPDAYLYVETATIIIDGGQLVLESDAQNSECGALEIRNGQVILENGRMDLLSDTYSSEEEGSWRTLPEMRFKNAQLIVNGGVLNIDEDLHFNSIDDNWSYSETGTLFDRDAIVVDYSNATVQGNLPKNVITAKYNVTTEDELREALSNCEGYRSAEVYLTNDVTVTGEMTVPAGVVVYVNGNYIEELSTTVLRTLTVAEEATLRVEGNITTNVGGNIQVDGNLAVVENGSLFINDNGVLTVNGELNNYGFAHIGFWQSGRFPTSGTLNVNGRVETYGYLNIAHNAVVNVNNGGELITSQMAPSSEDANDGMCGFVEMNGVLFANNGSRLTNNGLWAVNPGAVQTLNGGSEMWNGNCLYVDGTLNVEEGALLHNDMVIEVRGVLNHYENIEGNEPEIFDGGNVNMKAGDPYLSFRWLDNHGDGWFLDTNNGANRGATMCAWDRFHMVFYLNTWNENTEVWEEQMISPYDLTTNGVVKVYPFETIAGEDNDYGHIRDGETNSRYFMVLEAQEDTWDQVGEVTYNYNGADVTMEIPITRGDHGFYSSPIDSNATYLQQIEVDPLKGEYSFYFILHSDYWDLNGTVASGAVRLDEGADKVTIEDYAKNVVKITVPEEVARTMWDMEGGFGIHLFFDVVAKNDPNNVECWDNGMWIGVKWPDEADASFVIDGQSYDYHADSNGYVAWEPVGEPDEGGNYHEHRAVVADLPAGISYDYQNNILTLDNAKFASLETGYHWYDEENGNEGWNLPNDRLTINLIGDNYITSTENHAVSFNNGLNVAISGSGTLHVTAITSEESRHDFSAIHMTDDSTLTITGNAKVTAEIQGIKHWDNGEQAYMAAIRGNGADLTVKGNATLTTIVPEGAKGTGDTFVEEGYDDNGNLRGYYGGGYGGIENFCNILIQDNATVNTTELWIPGGMYDPWMGSYDQTGGTVNITALGGHHWTEKWEWDEEAHENVFMGMGDHYHYEAIGANEAPINISGGTLNIDITPSAQENGVSSYYHAINTSGELNISGGEIYVTTAYNGSVINLNDLYNENGWDCSGILNFSGGNLNVVNTTPGEGDPTIIWEGGEGIANMTGGEIFTGDARFELNAVTNWDGTYLTGSGVEFITGRDFKLYSGEINLRDHSVIRAGMTSVMGGLINLENSQLEVNDAFGMMSGELRVNNDEDGMPGVIIHNYFVLGDGEKPCDAVVDIHATNAPGILNFATFHQMGGTVDAHTSGGPGFNNEGTALLNRGLMNVSGFTGFASIYNESNPLSMQVQDGFTLNASGERMGVAVLGYAEWNGGNVNAYAETDASSDMPYPFAVAVGSLDNAYVDHAQLVINGGNHTLRAVDSGNGEARSKGLAAMDAPVYFNGGTLDIEAEMAIYSVSHALNETNLGDLNYFEQDSGSYLGLTSEDFYQTEDEGDYLHTVHNADGDYAGKLFVTPNTSMTQDDFLKGMAECQEWEYWIDHSVELTADITLTKNVVVADGKTLTIKDGATITIPEGFYLKAQNGGRIIIEDGGQIINHNSLENHYAFIIFENENGYVQANEWANINNYFEDMGDGERIWVSDTIGVPNEYIRLYGSAYSEGDIRRFFDTFRDQGYKGIEISAWNVTIYDHVVVPAEGQILVNGIQWYDANLDDMVYEENQLIIAEGANVEVYGDLTSGYLASDIILNGDMTVYGSMFINDGGTLEVNGMLNNYGFVHIGFWQEGNYEEAGYLNVYGQMDNYGYLNVCAPVNVYGTMNNGFQLGETEEENLFGFIQLGDELNVYGTLVNDCHILLGNENPEQTSYLNIHEGGVMHNIPKEGLENDFGSIELRNGSVVNINGTLYNEAVIVSWAEEDAEINVNGKLVNSLETVLGGGTKLTAGEGGVLENNRLMWVVSENAEVDMTAGTYERGQFDNGEGFFDDALLIASYLGDGKIVPITGVPNDAIMVESYPKSASDIKEVTELVRTEGYDAYQLWIEKDITIGKDEQVFVPKDSYLLVCQGATLTVEGSMAISGWLEVEGKVVIEEDAVIEVGENGNFYAYAPNEEFDFPGATVENYGTVVNNFRENSNIQMYGEYIHHEGASVVVNMYRGEMGQVVGIDLADQTLRTNIWTDYEDETAGQQLQQAVNFYHEHGFTSADVDLWTDVTVDSWVQIPVGMNVHVGDAYGTPASLTIDADNDNIVSNGNIYVYDGSALNIGSNYVNLGLLDVKSGATVNVLADGILNGDVTTDIKIRTGATLNNMGWIAPASGKATVDGTYIHNEGAIFEVPYTIRDDVVTLGTVDGLNNKYLTLYHPINANVFPAHGEETIHEMMALIQQHGYGYGLIYLLTDLTLTEDLTIPENMEIGVKGTRRWDAENQEYIETIATLTIPAGVVVTNNGTLSVGALGNLVIDGTLLGNPVVNNEGGTVTEHESMSQAELEKALAENGFYELHKRVVLDTDFTIQRGTGMIIGTGGELIVRKGETLFNEGEIFVEPDGQLLVQEGAKLINNGALSCNVAETAEGFAYGHIVVNGTFEQDEDGRTVCRYVPDTSAHIEGIPAEDITLTYSGNSEIALGYAVEVYKNGGFGGLEIFLGSMELNEDLTIPENGVVIVSGKVTINSNVTVDGRLVVDFPVQNNGTITVSEGGKIELNYEGTINGAWPVYEVAEAVDFDQLKVMLATTGHAEVGGHVVVTEDILLPEIMSGITIYEGGTLEIASGVTITLGHFGSHVQSSVNAENAQLILRPGAKIVGEGYVQIRVGKLTNQGTIDVPNGVTYFEHVDNQTDLINACNSGIGFIRVKGNMTLTKSLTVPEGTYIEIGDDVVLTINTTGTVNNKGRIDTNGGYIYYQKGTLKGNKIRASMPIANAPEGSYYVAGVDIDGWGTTMEGAVPGSNGFIAPVGKEVKYTIDSYEPHYADFSYFEFAITFTDNDGIVYEANDPNNPCTYDSETGVLKSTMAGVAKITKTPKRLSVPFEDAGYADSITVEFIQQRVRILNSNGDEPVEISMNTPMSGPMLKAEIVDENGNASNLSGTEIVWELADGADKFVELREYDGWTVPYADYITEAKTVTLIAKAKDGSAAAAEVKISYVPNTQKLSLFMNGADVSGENVTVDLNKTDSVNVQVAFAPAGAYEVVANWESSKQSVVDASAISGTDDGSYTIPLTGKTGTAKLTAYSFDGVAETITLKVVKPVAGIFSAESNKNYLTGGKSATYKVVDENGATMDAEDVKWWLVDENGEKISTHPYASIKSSTGKLTTKTVAVTQSIYLMAQVIGADDSAKLAQPIEVILEPQQATGVEIYDAEGNNVTNLTKTWNMNAYSFDEDGELVVGKNTTLTMDAVLYNEDGEVMENESVKWKSSDTKIAKISSTSGKITCLKPGTVTITATAQDGSGVKATFKLKVVKRMGQLELDAGKAGIAGGKELEIETSILPSDTTSKTLTWSVDDTSFASIDSDGILTTAKVTEPKTVTVTATAKDGSGVSASVEVTIYPATTKVKIQKDGETVSGTIYIAKGEKLDLDAIATPDGAMESYKWTTSNKKYVSIKSSTGVITGETVGKTATITATAQDGTAKKATLKVKVIKRVEKLELDGEIVAGKKTLKLGDEITITPSSPTIKALKWEIVSGAQFATIDEDTGKLSLKAVSVPQEVTVRASATDDSGVFTEATFQLYPEITDIAIRRADTGKTVTGKTVTLYIREEGETLDLDGIIEPADAYQNLKWSSSDKKYAKVSSSSGLVTAVKGGKTVTITATAKDGTGEKATMKIKTVQLLTSLDITNTKLYVTGGKSLTLKSKVGPTTAANQDVIWEIVEGGEYATINKDTGKLTAKKVTEQQTVTVRVSAADKSGLFAECSVLIYPAITNIQIKREDNGDVVTGKTVKLYLREKGETLDLETVITPWDGYDEIEWSTSSSKYAKVNAETGKVTAVKGGKTVTITAAAQDGSGKTATVKIKTIQLMTDLEITNSNLELAGGKSLTLKTEVAPSNVGNDEVKWEIVEGGAYATINAETGKLTAKKLASDAEPVNVTVRATAVDGSEVSAETVVTIYPATTKLKIRRVDNDKDVTGDTISLKKGKTLKVYADTTPDGASQNVKWSSSNSKYVKVDSKGKITVVKAGKTVTITCKAQDGSGKSATIKIKAK